MMKQASSLAKYSAIRNCRTSRSGKREFFDVAGRPPQGLGPSATPPFDNPHHDWQSFPMPNPTRLLFVCLGNICRSPSGENVMHHLIEEAGLADHFEMDSAGTAGWHVGKKPDSRMTTAARNRGIPMQGRARQVSPEDFASFDWIFAMDRSNYADLVEVREQCPDPTARLVLFCEFCERHDETEVPDPYYGGPEGFEKVLDLLEDGCGAFLKKWRENSLP